MLMTAMGSNPLHCLVCNGEVDPASMPLPASMVELVAHWQSIGGAFETLELDSGPYEAMAQLELADVRSSVNEEGMRLRLDLDRLRRCFYVVFQVMDNDGRFVVPDTCPECGHRLVEFGTGRSTRLICDQDSLAWVNP